jgi:hypothetical protein
VDDNLQCSYLIKKHFGDVDRIDQGLSTALVEKIFVQIIRYAVARQEIFRIFSHQE